MPNWNPNYPEVLGLEWLVTRDQKTRVHPSAPARMQRLPSTTTETINKLRLSAVVDPNLRASIPTVIDVIEEGNETIPLMDTAVLAPNSDVAIGNWTTFEGGTTNLWSQIDDDPYRWPGPADGTGIQVTSTNQFAEFSVNASLFDTLGAAENGRIGWVSVQGIFGANKGVRKLGIRLKINGTLYDPAAGAARDVHYFGIQHFGWWGEINPATKLPWTPADIADFDVGGNSTIVINSGSVSTPQHFQKCLALALEVRYSPVENREAVGVWRRPELIGKNRLINIETDNLVSLPGNAPGWAKESGKNYLFFWRTSISPSEYGPFVADDVRWNGCYQELAPNAQPPGRAYALHSAGVEAGAPPSDVLASQDTTHDFMGRPSRSFDASRITTKTIVPEDNLGNPSVDGQPYRLDIADVGHVRVGQKIGQRVTMPNAQTYVAYRLPIIPPPSGNSILKVSVHRVSDGVQVGGHHRISRALAHRQPQTDGIRTLTRYFEEPITLSSGVAYEIRVSIDSGTTPTPWFVFVPDSSLAPEVSFGGASGDGAYIGSTHHANRDLAITLIRQPDAPKDLDANIEAIPIEMADTSTRDVEIVNPTWTAPDTPLGAGFVRYELDRMILPAFDESSIESTFEDGVGTWLEQGFSGNILHTTGTFEDNAGAWTPANANVAATRSNDQAHSGSWSFKVTRINSTGLVQAISGDLTVPLTPVSPGETIQTTMWVRHDRPVDLNIWTRHGYALDSMAVGNQDSDLVAVPPGTWVELTHTAVVPAGVNQLRLIAISQAVDVGESMWVDDVEVRKALGAVNSLRSGAQANTGDWSFKVTRTTGSDNTAALSGDADTTQWRVRPGQRLITSYAIYPLNAAVIPQAGFRTYDKDRVDQGLLSLVNSELVAKQAEWTWVTIVSDPAPEGAHWARVEPTAFLNEGETYFIDDITVYAVDDDPTWDRVANLRDETLLDFPDYMAPRRLTSLYRVRSVAKDGRISAWADSGPAVPEKIVPGKMEADYSIMLTSNHHPEMTVVMDADPEYGYEFLSTSNNETVALHGSDYQVVFSEAEDRGVGWKASVDINFGDEPPVVKAGQRVFTPLLKITDSDEIPYVVAMDHQGTRILGHVTPSDATQSHPGNVYKAALAIIPMTATEVPVEVDL